MDIKYSVTLHSYWHCGSGLAAGADVDLLVVKDQEGLPFIPGKTIKGLIREAVEELSALENNSDTYELSEEYIKTFGIVEVKHEGDSTSTKMEKSQSFFSNVELAENERKEIVSAGLVSQLYDGISQTSIDEGGIAIDHSLRKSEVVIPCKLFGKIINVPDGYVSTLKEAMAFIKNIGHGRNRGLGRCTIEMEER